jgi:hypothetical protein
LKIQQGKSEAANQRTDNKMTNIKGSKEQTMIYKTLQKHKNGTTRIPIKTGGGTCVLLLSEQCHETDIFPQ